MTFSTDKYKFRLIGVPALVAGILLSAFSPGEIQSVHAQNLGKNFAKAKELSLTEFGWLEGASDPTEHLTSEPVTCLSDVSAEQETLSNVGAVAFRSPFLFGGLAARKKLSCHACHQNGGVNPAFFIDGLSDAPGRIDATNAVFSKKLEDNKFNPIDIPTLYEINNKKAFGTLTSLPTKEDFVHHVIETEFDGPVPNQRIFDGLLAYINRFDDGCKDDNRERIARAVSRDFEKVISGMKTAQAEWRAGNNDVANFILLSTRHELGTINERYKPLKRAEKSLYKLALRAELIQSRLSNQSDLSVQDFEQWHKQAVKTLKRLQKLETRSYYQPEKLRALIQDK